MDSVTVVVGWSILTVTARELAAGKQGERCRCQAGGFRSSHRGPRRSPGLVWSVITTLVYLTSEWQLCRYCWICPDPSCCHISLFVWKI